MNDQGVFIQYIQPGKPNKNAIIERFNRTNRNEVLNLYLFRDLDEAREITVGWLIEYNKLRPPNALGGLPPNLHAIENAKDSTLGLST